MFDLGWSKVLILAVVAIVVVGPKELPALLRTVGQFIAQLRRHAAEFRAQFDEAIRSTELDQIKKDVEAIKTDAQASLRGIERSIEDDVGSAKASVDRVFDTPMPSAADPAPAATAGEHSSSEAPVPEGSDPVGSVDPATMTTVTDEAKPSSLAMPEPLKTGA